MEAHRVTMDVLENLNPARSEMKLFLSHHDFTIKEVTQYIEL